jgi:hypothetical protein
MRMRRFIAAVVLTLFATAAVAVPRDSRAKEPPRPKILKKLIYLIQSLEGGYISPPRP